MTYYLLPKTNHSFLIQMNIQNERLEPCISPSLFFSYQKITEQLIDLFFRETDKKEEKGEEESMNDSEKLFETYNYVRNDSNIESISRIFHPYEYLFTPLNIYNGTLESVPKNMEGQLLPINELKGNSPVEDCPISSKKMPNSNFSVSKLKSQKENFYDFYEIIKTIYLFENFYKKNISILNISPNTDAINQCIQLVREHLNDEISYYSSFDSYSYSSSSKETEKNFDFIFYELNKEKYQNDNDYIIGLIQIVILLLKTQKQGGFCIIKINTIFLKPVLDIIYFISSLYQKTYIMKPTVNNMATFHKYLICKNFIEDSFSKPSYCEKFIYYLEKFKVHQEKNMKMPIYISSIIDSSLPCYFVSKINDINIILGQQQLDAIHQMILFFKNKNKDKMNQLIKMHIYKSIKWCEKFKIPYNSIDIGIF